MTNRKGVSCLRSKGNSDLLGCFFQNQKNLEEEKQGWQLGLVSSRFLFVLRYKDDKKQLLKKRVESCDTIGDAAEHLNAMILNALAASKGLKMATGQSNCFRCKDSFCGKRYVMKEENAFCVKCYDSLFANFCEKCHKAIECDSKDLAYKGCHWHETCFKCAQCHHSLVEKPFAAKDERLLCTTCYSNEYSSKCFHCKRTIMPGSRKMEFKGNCWHEACFVCRYCRQPLGMKPLITKDDDNYCVPCYEKQFAQYCYSCKKVVTNGGVTYHDQPWHKECFLCTGCKKQLAEHRFMSKDEHPFCLECFSGHFAKKCVACTEPITALGGGKFILFEEHQWHSDCFKCSQCACSLVGKNFLTQQDQVLCCNCGSSI